MSSFPPKQPNNPENQQQHETIFAADSQPDEKTVDAANRPQTTPTSQSSERSAEQPSGNRRNANEKSSRDNIPPENFRDFIGEIPYKIWPWLHHVSVSIGFLIILVGAFHFQKFVHGRRFDNWQKRFEDNFYTEIPFDMATARELARRNLYQASVSPSQQSLIQELDSILATSLKDIENLQLADSLEENNLNLEQAYQQLQALQVQARENPDTNLNTQIADSLERIDGIINNREKLNNDVALIAQSLNNLASPDELRAIRELRAELTEQEKAIGLQLCNTLLASQNNHNLFSWVEHWNIEQTAEADNSNVAPITQPNDDGQSPTPSDSDAPLPGACQQANLQGKLFADEYMDEVMTIILAAGLNAREGEKIQLLRQMNIATIKSEQAITRARYYYIHLFASLWLIIPLGLVAGYALFQINQKGWSVADSNLKQCFFVASASLFLMFQVPLLFRYEDNFEANRDLYIGYEQIQSDITSFLATGYGFNRVAANSPNEAVINTSLSTSTTAQFIHSIEFRLAALNKSSLRIGLDRTALPDYTTIFAPLQPNDQNAPPDAPGDAAPDTETDIQPETGSSGGTTN
jgi:hypothetical protein